MLLSIHKEKTDEISLFYQCILWSEWREKTYLWYLLRGRLFAVKDLKCRFFQKNNLLTLMDNLFSGSKENTYLFFFLIYFLNKVCAVLGVCCENLFKCPFLWYFTPLLKTPSACLYFNQHRSRTTSKLIFKKNSYRNTEILLCCIINFT